MKRRNWQAILGFECLWGVGTPFVQSNTTLPGYLSALHASGILIGLVPAVFAGGIAVIQPFSLYLIRPGPLRFRRMMQLYQAGAVCYLLMAASALLIPAGAAAAHIAVFFVLYTAYVLIAGAGDPHYISMVVASVPDEERGRFFGLRMVWFGIGGLVGGLFAAPVLRVLEAPRNFGLSILIGGLVVLAATIWFSRLGSDPDPEPGDDRPALAACLADVWHLAARRRTFLLFIAAASLFVLAQGPFAFMALFIKERLRAGDALLGQLSFLLMACNLGFALALGSAGDRFGHRGAFLVGLLLYAGGLAAVMLGRSPMALLAGYFVASSCGPVWSVAAFNLGYECAGEQDAGRVYAAISLVSAPLRILGPLAAGAGVDRCGYPPVFGGAVVCAVAALLLALLVRGPRR